MSLKVYTGQGDGHSPSLYYKGPKANAVDPCDEESLAYWAKSLEVTRSELLEAIKQYGVVVRDIRRGLVNQKSNAA